MEWLTQTLYWYVHLFVLGLVFLPLTKRLFPRFIDNGYSFSKTIGIILVSYIAFLLGVLKIVPFTQLALYGIIAVCVALNVYLYLKDRKKGTFLYGSFSRQFMYIFQEFIFLGALIFLAYVRGQEPSVHGLEKFMDFGFMNSILKSDHFPPLDMWYSAGPDVNGVDHPQGFPINYYYFGHLTGAMLIKFTGIPSYIGYNLILATILAQGAALAFSLVANIVQIAMNAVKPLLKKIPDAFSIPAYIFGIVGSYILNLAGNLHTIYAFTRGYSNETPVPFWHIFDSFNPTKYWYPNATRFIPFTIHEFPSYSYVVADLHGHVFDIPFVLLTIALLFHIFYSHFVKDSHEHHHKIPKLHFNLSSIFQRTKAVLYTWNGALTVILGFMCAIHYMTNAFDGPIYLLFCAGILFLIHKISFDFLLHLILLAVSYLIFSLPFTAHFALFVSGVGVNCAPDFMFNNVANGDSLKFGPFVFEKGNCQRSAFWMMFVLWGFFWISFMIFSIIKAYESRIFQKTGARLLNRVLSKIKGDKENLTISVIDTFMMVIFLLGTFLIIVPEFFYVKDIYPAHFRANTMFKLGYQAFMMMSIASMYILFRVKLFSSDHPRITKLLASVIFAVYLIILQLSPDRSVEESVRNTFPLERLFFIPIVLLVVLCIYFRREAKTILSLIFIYIIVNALMLVSIYPFFSFSSYYGDLKLTAEERRAANIKTSLNGIEWLNDTNPEDLEIIFYINEQIPGQPVILEAQGDSYTDYERISAYTGNPTVAGWWVHEWLWRGSSDVVGKRLGDISTMYESSDLSQTKALFKKYNVKYVVVSKMERDKYPNLNEKKFSQIGKKVFESSNKLGALYQLN